VRPSPLSLQALGPDHCDALTTLRLRPRVVFEGEAGIDSGGLTKDWMQGLALAVLSPAAGLFRLCAGTEHGLYQVDPRSAASHSGSYLQHYRAVGRLYAKAVYEKQPVDAVGG
jgi:hypothetical protein